jgi:amino acid adenylation domain-containing protein/non-ribosomal peptide synthase protein (TIGR01720 family)
MTRSPQQQRLDALAREGGVPLVARCLVRWPGPVDGRRLNAALPRLMQRHGVEPRLSIEEGHRVAIELPATCADAIGLANLVVDLMACYESDHPPPWSAPPYARVAAWLAELQTAEETREGVAFWRARHAALAGAAGAPLPFGRRWTPHPYAEPLSVDLPAAVSVDPPRIAAAWIAFLHRHTGESKFVLGVRADGRRHDELAGVIGLLARMLPIAIAVNGDDTLAMIDQRLDAAVREVVARQDYFAWPDGDPLLSTFAAEPERPDFIESVRDRIDRFALQLAVDGERIRLDFDPAIFNDAEAAALADQLSVFLADAAARPDSRVAALALIGEEKRPLLETITPIEPGRALPDLFAHRARTAPDRTAVVSGDERVTYGELDRRSEALARSLASRGIGCDDVVALHCAAGPEFVVAMLGILRAGAAYLPLDPSYPIERLQFMVADSAARAIVTPPGMPPELFEGPSLPVDCDDGGDTALPKTIPPDSLAYVIYTSGSTGVPKGVHISHRSALASTLARPAVYGEPVERYLLLSPASFDSSIAGLFWTLLDGGMLVFPPAAARSDVAALGALIERERVTHLLALPSLWRLLVEFGDGALASLRTVIVAGESCPAELVALHAARLPMTRLFNEYGPTEAAVWCSVFDCARMEPGRQVPIGSAIPGAALHVLDENLQPLAIGLDGDLYVGGAGVARGYGARPDATAAAFLPDPFCGDGARMYRTGDRVRRLPAGDLEFLGRADGMVKIRGHRIELGEVESHLRAIESIAECTVVVSGEQLLAACVPRAGAAIDDGALRASLTASLPSWMIPQHFAVVDSLPRLDNGKVDREAIIAGAHPAAGRSAAPDGRRPPAANGTEALMAIWSALLRAGDVGIHDDFFAAGGDSILAIQVAARARQAGLDVRASDLFEHPTIARLAAAVAMRTPSRAPVVRSSAPAPLTPVQHWFLDTDPVDRHHFVQIAALEPRRPVDPVRLRDAVRALGEHHGALRMRFTCDRGEWMQSPAGDPVEMEIVVCGGDFDEDIARDAAGRIEQLDIERGPVVRFVCYTSPARTRLVVIAHHLVIDAVSWGILAADLDHLVAGEALPPPSTLFTEWAARLDREADDPKRLDEAGAWLAQPWSDAPPLPRDREDGANTQESTRAVSVTLPAAETASLLRDAQAASRATPLELLLSALARTLGRWSGGATLVELEDHGRRPWTDDVDLSRSVGWFTSAFPLLLPSSDVRTVKERVREATARGLGFGILRELAREESLRDLPRPEVRFNFLGRIDAAPDGLFAAVEPPPVPWRSGLARRDVLLEIVAAISGGMLRIDWTYSTSLHDEGTVARLAGDMLDALRTLLAGDAAASALVPGDFPLARLDQRSLQLLLQRNPGLADVYALSPMQENMLFASVYANEAEAYVQQVSGRLRGPLDAGRFREAWQRLADEMPLLRTTIEWQGLTRPVQVVHRRAAIAFTTGSEAAAIDLARGPLLHVSLSPIGADLWQLAITHHHILLDGWSLALLLREVLAIYGGTAPRPSRPYRDFVEWLQSRGVAGAPTSFWRDELANRPVLPRLGFDEARGSAGRAKRAVSLPAATTAALENAARASRVTPGTRLLAGWASALARFHSQRDVIFGVTSAGRPPDLAGSEEMIGLFINALPLRVAVPETWTDADLQNLQRRFAAMRAHEQTPPADIRAAAGVPRGEELFETLLVIENYPVGFSLQTPLDGVTLDQLHVIERTDRPLTAMAIPGGELALEIEFRTDLLPADVADRLLEAWRDALMRMAAPQEEGTAMPNVQTMFVEAAKRHAQLVAIDAEPQPLLYGELAGRSNRLAAELLRRGFGPGAKIGILSDDVPFVITAILATLRIAAAFVPFDSRSPAKRIAGMIAAVEPGLIITDARLSALLPESAPFWIPEDGAASLPPSGEILLPMDRDAMAYVTFTSGSTGTPKAIAGRLGAIDHFIRWETEMIGAAPGTRVSQLTSPAYDAFLRDVFTPLCNGGTICIPPDRERILQPAGLRQWLESARVDVLHCVPSVFRLLLDDSLGAGSLPDLRAVLLAGEPLLPADVKVWCGAVGTRIRLVNLYGPSETVMTKLFHVVSPGDAAHRAIPIGRPMPEVEVLILTRRGRACARGDVGEIHIRTRHRALGYYGQPELTAQVFIANPLGHSAEDVLYKTGDLGRIGEDGNVELLGRIDHQLKLHGVRIEPGEIENRLREHPGVREAAVVMRDDGDAPHLCAFLVADPTLDMSSVGASLHEVLPPAMVPSRYIVRERLPRTLTGKIDRQELESMPLPKRRPDRAFVPPSTEVQRVIAAIWSDLLQAGAIGRDESFFDLGGHSIVAIQLLARIRDMFGADVALRDLFAHPVLEDLAAHIETLMGRPASAREAPLVARPELTEAPLSFSQQRLWFLEQLNPDTAAYNLPAAIRVRGALDVEVLRRTLRVLIDRHQVFRSAFEVRDGEAVQRLSAVAEVPLRIVDAGDDSEEERDWKIAAILRDEIALPFDLSRAPLLRVLLVRRAEDDHVLLLTMHHIIADGWSLGILFREVGALYGAFASGAEPSLPELPIRYFDYAWWQRERLQGELLNGQLAYWRGKLAAVPAVELPADRPRPPVPSFRGDRMPFAFDRDLSARLSALAREHNVTLFMLLLAAFQTLLHRYTGQSDIVVGTPVANRRRREVQDEIGFFANTLVLRTDFAGDPSVAALLQRVRETALGAYTHEEVAFEQVVKDLQPERDLSRQPLFQVAFVLQNTAAANVRIAGLEFGDHPLEAKSARFDLTLEMFERNGALAGEAEYSADLFDAPTIAGMLRHYETLLRSMAADPSRRVSELPIMLPAERTALLPRPAQSFAGGSTLHTLFEAQAALHGDEIAIVDRTFGITYDDLDRRANRLAHHLHNQGAGPESIVGLCLERSAELMIAVLATLKAGAAYLPLDPLDPEERTQFMLGEAGARLIVTSSDLRERFAACAATIVSIDDDAGVIAACPESRLDVAMSDASLAYVIFTSGSTGQPKGVLVEHRNVVQLFAATAGTFEITDSDVWTLFHSYAFDFSVWEMWGALLHGGRLVIASYWQTRSPEAFLRLLRTERVTVLNQTPSAFWQLAQAEEQSEQPISPWLRLVIFGGEALELSRLQSWFARHGDYPQLVNMYGITETTVHVTARPLVTEDAGLCGSVIGDALPHLTLHVLDPAMNPAPVGVPGEIYVGGTGVSRGYHAHPDLTAARFVPDPFSNEPGARLYRSGDRARRLPNGELQYHGRGDKQVKLRGYRIETGEIEAALAAHPTISRAVVTLRSDNGRPPALVAHVVPRHHTLPPIEELRGALARRLPAHMIPAHFVFLEALPLTRNGKIDHAALPAPELAQRAASDGIAPRNRQEQDLAEIFAEVLGVESVGMQDGFFALGGDSIRSIQLCSQARQRGMEITLQQLFVHQTVEELARAVATRTAGSGPPARGGPFSLLAPADYVRLPEGIHDAYPMAALQTGMLFHSDYDERSSAYHDVFTYRLRAPFDGAALTTSVTEVMRRHAVLRTSFDLTTYAEPLQIVHEDVAPPVEVIDIRPLSGPEQETVLARSVAEHVHRHRNWTQPPLFSIRLHRLADDVFQFSLGFHHAILDGWSVASLLTELFRHYFSLLDTNRLADIAPPRQLYRDFVEAEKRAIVSPAARTFWEQQLEGAELCTLPRRASAGSASGRDVRQYSVPLPESLWRELNRVANEAGASLKSALLAAHVRVLGILCNRADVITGLVANTRLEERDGERVLGLYLNTVPFRMLLHGGSWLELVQRVFETELALVPHRRFPSALLVRERRGVPLFEAVFNFTQYHVYRNLRGFTDVEILDGKIHEETNYPLTANFSVDVTTSGLRLMLLYDADIIDPDGQIAEIGGYYAGALADLAHNPTAPYDRAPLLNDGARRELRRAWTGRFSGWPETRGVHELIAEQAGRTPAAVAAVAGDATFTYAELDERAGRIAAALAGLGVQRESVVGVRLETSPDALVAMLAVWKAGAAYLPLDPRYPAERLELMREDSGASLVITPEVMEELSRAASAPVLTRDTHPDQLAYVIYTSGSTGRPKGVGVPHRALVHFLSAMQRHLGVAASDAIFAHTSLSFDIAGLELFLPLVSGARVVFAPPEARNDAARLAASLLGSGATFVQATPTTWRLLAGEGWRDPRVTAVCGGEALPSDLAETLLDRAGRLWNVYGPTETAIWSTAARIERNGPLSIGRPVGATVIHVLSHDLHEVPAGTEGDLYIGGPGLARGYHSLPDRTAAAFLPDPFTDASGARMYRTGDRARILPGHVLEFLGRADEQVKIRGQRIEPGEIEAHLAAHPAVRQAVVVLDEGRLRAHVSTMAALTASDLRTFLRAKLPDAMVPSDFVFHDALPSTPNGKLDRGALRRLVVARPAGEHVRVAARDRTELQIAAIAEELLGCPVGVFDDLLLDCGASSLDLIRIVAKIRVITAAHVSVSTLLEAPTVAAVAARLREGVVTSGSPLVALQSRGTKPPFFCVHPATGNVLPYIRLAQLLGPDQPFYGLQAPGAEGEAAPLERVEEMAALYAAAIRRIQPEGPYHLGGHSFGGVVALEIARLLAAGGEPAALLALIDTFLPDGSIPEPDLNDDARWLCDTARMAERFLGLSLPVSYDDLRELPAAEQIACFTRMLDRAGVLPSGAGTPFVEALLRVQKANARAMSAYRPSLYAGPITLFRATDIADDDRRWIPEGQLADPTRHWQRHSVEPVRVVPLDGDHIGILTTGVEALATALRDALHAAQTPASAMPGESPGPRTRPHVARSDG